MRNARKACKLGNYDNLLCFGHGVHNSVYTDGSKKTPDVLEITTKARRIVKALRYKSSDFYKISDETVTFLDEMTRISDSDPFIDDEDDDEYDDDGSESDDEEYLTDPSNYMKSLKLDVVTRWYSTLAMLESLKSRGRYAINIVLQK